MPELLLDSPGLLVVDYGARLGLLEVALVGVDLEQRGPSLQRQACQRRPLGFRCLVSEPTVRERARPLRRAPCLGWAPLRRPTEPGTLFWLPPSRRAAFARRRLRELLSEGPRSQDMPLEPPGLPEKELVGASLLESRTFSRGSSRSSRAGSEGPHSRASSSASPGPGLLP